MADVARLNVEIDHALDEKLSQLIPRSFKSEVVRAMLEILVDDIEEHGLQIIGEILDKTYRYKGSIQNLKSEGGK